MAPSKIPDETPSEPRRGAANAGDALSSAPARQVDPVRVVVVWTLLALAMIVQGAAREAILTPTFGPLRAHQLSSLTGSAIVIFGSALSLKWLGAVQNVPLQLRIGGIWLSLTILFEFGFGHFVMGHGWSALLADYDVSEGRLWSLVVLATLFGPFVAGRFVGPRPPP